MSGGIRAWVIVFSGFIIGFITDGIRYSYGILFLEFLREFKENKATTAWIGSIMFSLMNLLGPVTSVLINMYGCRAVTVFGGVVCAVAYISSVFGTSVYYLYVTLGLLGGLGFALLVIPFNIMIVQYFQRRRAVALGIAMCGSGIGSLAFSPLTKTLIDRYGWRGTLLIEGALLLNMIPCGLVMQPLENQEKDEHEPGEIDTLTATKNSQYITQIKHSHTTNPYTKDNHACNLPNSVICDKDSENEQLHKSDSCDMCSKNDFVTNNKINSRKHSTQRKAEIRDIRKYFNIQLFKNIDFEFTMISCIIEGLAYSVLFNFLPDMIVSQGFSRLDATWLLSTLAMANTVVRIPIGLLADVKSVDSKYLYVTSLCLLGIAKILIGFSKNFQLLLALCVLYGIFVGSYSVLLPLVLVDVFTEEYLADTKGFVGLANGIAGLIGLPIAGALFDATGNYTLTFSTAGTEFIISGIVFSFIICHAAIKSKSSKPRHAQSLVMSN